MNTREFMSFVKKECKKHKVNFVEHKTAGIPLGEIVVNGYFSSDVGGETLAISTGKPEENWLRILIHEFCHMQQWIEQSKSWTDCHIEDVDANTIFELWILGVIELTPRQKKKVFLKIMENEADCERRVIKMARKHKLDINEEEYSQKSNAYVLFYLHVMKTRKWYKIGKEPYNDKSIYPNMPKTIIKNLSRVNPKLIMLFK